MSEQREQFQKSVEALVEQVKSWSEPHDWVTKEYPKKLRNGSHELFVVPSLVLQRGPVRVILDPVAYDVPGSEAVVDLYLMPAYDDLASLYLAAGEWTIHYPLPPDVQETHSEPETKSLPLSEATINQVLDSIAAHAESSV
ncbi:MAG TPA: hypothetical protein VFI31_29345 [Pirellulales bacterium]|nr:hypothetical protein [Pirellulales bacterium]